MTNITVSNVYKAMDSIAPFSWAESWDNVGLLIGNMQAPVKKIMLALDITSQVLKEANENSCSVIITHHPIIFHPIKHISSSSLVYQCIQQDIAVISAHTNLDVADYGVNHALANAIDLKDLETLFPTKAQNYFKISTFVPTASSDTVYAAMAKAGAGDLGNYSGCVFEQQGIGKFLPKQGANPTIGKCNTLEEVEEVKIEMIVSPRLLEKVITALKEFHPYEEPAYDIVENHAVQTQQSLGLIGYLQEAMSAKEFASHIKLKLNAATVRYSDNKNPIRKVGLCSGSGNSVLLKAIEQQCDAYVTGELAHDKHMLANEYQISVLEAGHFSTEAIFMYPLAEQLKKYLPQIDVICSQSCTDNISAV